MIAAIWIAAALLLGLWSLGAWGVHALLAMDPRWLDDVEGMVDRVPYAEIIDRWFPGWQQLLKLSLDLAQTALGWVGDAAPVIVWTAWSFGALVLAAFAVGLTVLVRVLRRRDDTAPRAPA